MIRRSFLKFFGGASAAAAVTVGPKVAEAIQRSKEEPLGGQPYCVNPKKSPRNVQGFALSDDLLTSLGFGLNLTKKDVLRIDEVLKSAKAVPQDAVLETVFPATANQLAIIFHYRHPSLQLIRGFDCMWVEGVDTGKLKKFMVRT